ncbi:MAG: gamma-glutamylcyclotransferase family protein [Actinomycetota bacterium]|jgi:gamma-glutamylcyclotransferase (GGCT)/AIG2-like uncharacterized protein YtfP
MSGTIEPRPVFVYGTLRPGQPNWERLLAGRCERAVSGRLAGVVLLDCGHYPAAVERPGAGGALGQVLWIRPADWPAVVAALDHLEGYDAADPDRLFDRVVRPVETVEGPVDCWVYLAGRDLARSALPVVADGDWEAHCADLPHYRQRWEAIAEGGGRAPGPSR